MSIQTHLIFLRLGAVALMILSVYLLSRVMFWLPWQIDCLIAGVVALAFAYRFEREESH